MKRIEFIAPVRAMRGNLGETQRDIVYPTHDNRAYDGPEGEKNTARNYQPIIVGAERRNGLQYFSVRTKTSNHLTPLAKKSMAVMGAACAVYAAMRKDATIAAKMEEAYAFVQPSLYPGTTEKSFFMQAITLTLRDKESVITIYAGEKGFTVNNPFVEGGDGDYDVTISNDILVKFWMELASNPITFTVGELVGVAHDGDMFVDIIAGHYNVLGLSHAIVDDFDALKLGDMFVNEFDTDFETDVTVDVGELTFANYNYTLSVQFNGRG